MNKIALAADIHMGRGSTKGLIQYKKTFEELISGMISVMPKYAVFAGDLFNKVSWFTPETFHEIMMSGFSALNKAGIEVILLAGNHDYDNTGSKHALSPFDRFDGITVFDTISAISDPDYYMVFVPWHTKVALKANEVNVAMDAQDMVYEIHERIIKPEMESHAEYIACTPHDMKTSICIFHASLIGFSPCDCAGSIVGTDFLLDPKYLETLGFAHIVGGHFHKRQESGRAAYIGSMERNDFGEKDFPTGFMVIEGGNREWIKLESAQKFLEISFESASGFDYSHLCTGFHVKVKPVMSRHDIIDRPGIKKQLMENGAKSVKFDPQYTDEVQVRSQSMKAEAPMHQHLKVWCEENPEKAHDGLLEKIFEFESGVGFPDGDDFDTNSHVESLLKTITGG